MSEPVKTPRAYRSSRREQQAAQTRQDILGAAGALFRERGYAAISMPQIAASADVAVETVYRAFGSKAGLFKAVIEAVVAGGGARADVPVEERPAIRAIIEERDPQRQIELYAATQPGIHRRSGPLLTALAGVIGTDPALDALWHQIEGDRRTGQGRFVGMLAERGVLRADLTVEDAGDIVWTLCSLAVYQLLVAQRGWAPSRYEVWLAATLIHDLLPR